MGNSLGDETEDATWKDTASLARVRRVLRGQVGPGGRSPVIVVGRDFAVPMDELQKLLENEPERGVESFGRGLLP
jgi:hypothetical protein